MSSSNVFICAACNENISEGSKVMKAKDKFYHENHFVCNTENCLVNLLASQFFIR